MVGERVEVCAYEHLTAFGARTFLLANFLTSNIDAYCYGWFIRDTYGGNDDQNPKDLFRIRILKNNSDSFGFGFGFASLIKISRNFRKKTFIIQNLDPTY